jgi:hypothetical protein
MTEVRHRGKMDSLDELLADTLAGVDGVEWVQKTTERSLNFEATPTAMSVVKRVVLSHDYEILADYGTTPGDMREITFIRE